jgi:AcrR family transcriptional regulator
MTDPELPRARRPGGRSARVRADVHAAVEALQSEHPMGEITMARIAERSGVHLGTLYRRWGSLDGVLLDVVSERLTARSPVPATGDYPNDLREYARQAAEDLAGPEGVLLLRTLVSVQLDDGRSLPPALSRRFDDLQDMLDRAAGRGETVPTSEEVFELVIAPLCASLLFGTDPPDVHRLVERVDLVAAHAADTRGE